LTGDRAQGKLDIPSDRARLKASWIFRVTVLKASWIFRVIVLKASWIFRPKKELILNAGHGSCIDPSHGR
jgi:hypothetical protein